MPYVQHAIANKLLVAMPDLAGGFFEKSVILMLEHNQQGAMGLTLTHESNMTVASMLKNIDFELKSPKDVHLERSVMVGGPVQPDRGFILHRGQSRWENTARIADDLSLTVSLDFLHALADNQVTEEYEIFLGYAGWGAGQLEQELRDNHWLFAEATHEIIFDLPAEVRWQAAFDSLGININRLSRVTGHA